MGTYDLLTLVVIKLGDEVYNGREDEEGYGLLRFLNTIMYPHQKDFKDKVSEHIDFSDNEEFWKEAKHMTGLGQSVFEDGVRTGKVEGREEGIKALVLDNLEDGASRERILESFRNVLGLQRKLPYNILRNLLWKMNEQSDIRQDKMALV